MSMRSLRQCALTGGAWVLSLAVPVAGCGGTDLQSTPVQGEVVVDGDLTDWEANLTTIEDDRASVGVQNDGEYLYLALATSDRRTQMQVLAQGFTVWVDPEGGKDEVRGVRFPLGAGRQMREMSRERLGGEEGEGGAPDRAEAQEQMNELVTLNQSNFQLLDGTDTTSVEGNEAEGVQVALGRGGGVLVYEVRLPFRSREAGGFAIGIPPGGTFGMGFTTPELPERARGMRGPGGRGGFGGEEGFGGGGPGMGGGPGGGMRPPGPGGPGGRPGPPEPIDTWVKVKTSGM